MNVGSSVFLIFLLIVAAFAGLGYLISEISRQEQEIRDLQLQNDAFTSELQILHNQNRMLGQEADAARLAANELEAANQMMQGEITIMQQDLDEERIKNYTLLMEKEDLEVKWSETNAKNDELSKILKDAWDVNQALKEENVTLQRQISNEASLKKLFFTDTTQIPSPFNQSRDMFSWILLPPIFLAAIVISGYRFQRKNRGTQNRTRHSYRSLCTRHSTLKKTNPVSSGMVTIRMNRGQLNKYITWLRQTS